MKRQIIAAEWVVTFMISGCGPGRRVKVKVENAEPEDQAFAQALVRVAEVWVNRAFRTGRPRA